MRIVDLFRDGAPGSVQVAVAAMETVVNTTREMWVASTSALLYNANLELDLAETDIVVDAQERTIRKLVHEHVESNPKRDIDLSLVIVSIVQDGERIGDLSKSIGGLCELVGSPLIGPATFHLRAVRDRITVMFDETRAGFIDGDVRAASHVMAENRDIKAGLRAFVRELAGNDSLSVNEAVILASASLMMGRVSSHLSNIASTVVLPFEDIRGSSPEYPEG